MLEEKLQPYIKNIENGVLPQPILAGPQQNDQKVQPSYFETSIHFSILTLVILSFICFIRCITEDSATEKMVVVLKTRDILLVF